MKVIFLQDVPRAGNRYDIKEVNAGYAINFLFPNKLAELATSKTIAELEKKKKNVKIERDIQTDLLMKNLREIGDKIVHIAVKADEKGHLFSGIHKKEISEAMQTEHKIEISEEFIVLEKPIKEVGEFDIVIEIKGKKSSFKLIIENA